MNLQIKIDHVPLRLWRNDDRRLSYVYLFLCDVKQEQLHVFSRLIYLLFKCYLRLGTYPVCLIFTRVNYGENVLLQRKVKND